MSFILLSSPRDGASYNTNQHHESTQEAAQKAGTVAPDIAKFKDVVKKWSGGFEVPWTGVGTPAEELAHTLDQNANICTVPWNGGPIINILQRIESRFGERNYASEIIGSEGAYVFMGSAVHLIQDQTSMPHGANVRHGECPETILFQGDNFEGMTKTAVGFTGTQGIVDPINSYFSALSVTQGKIPDLKSTTHVEFDAQGNLVPRRYWLFNDDLLARGDTSKSSVRYAGEATPGLDKFGDYGGPDGDDIYSDSEKPGLYLEQGTQATDYAFNFLLKMSKALPPIASDLTLDSAPGSPPVINLQTGSAIKFAAIENRTEKVDVDIFIQETGKRIVTEAGVLWIAGAHSVDGVDAFTNLTGPITWKNKEVTLFHTKATDLSLLPFESQFNLPWKGKIEGGAELDEGNYTLCVVVKDKDNQSSPSAQDTCVVFEVDRTPPEVVEVRFDTDLVEIGSAPANVYITENQRPKIVATIEDHDGVDPDSVRMHLNGDLLVIVSSEQANAVVASYFPNADISYGAHELEIVASDFAGNTSTTTVLFEIRAATETLPVAAEVFTSTGGVLVSVPTYGEPIGFTQSGFVTIEAGANGNDVSAIAVEQISGGSYYREVTFAQGETASARFPDTGVFANDGRYLATIFSRLGTQTTIQFVVDRTNPLLTVYDSSSPVQNYSVSDVENTAGNCFLALDEKTCLTEYPPFIAAADDDLSGLGRLEVFSGDPDSGGTSIGFSTGQYSSYHVYTSTTELGLENLANMSVQDYRFFRAYNRAGGYATVSFLVRRDGPPIINLLASRETNTPESAPWINRVFASEFNGGYAGLKSAKLHSPFAPDREIKCAHTTRPELIEKWAVIHKTGLAEGTGNYVEATSVLDESTRQYFHIDRNIPTLTVVGETENTLSLRFNDTVSGSGFGSVHVVSTTWPQPYSGETYPPGLSSKLMAFSKAEFPQDIVVYDRSGLSASITVPPAGSIDYESGFVTETGTYEDIPSNSSVDKCHGLSILGELSSTAISVKVVPAEVPEVEIVAPGSAWLVEIDSLFGSTVTLQASYSATLDPAKVPGLRLVRLLDAGGVQDLTVSIDTETRIVAGEIPGVDININNHRYALIVAAGGPSVPPPDRTPPVTTLSYDGPSFSADPVYVATHTVMVLTSVDPQVQGEPRSGVLATVYMVASSTEDFPQVFDNTTISSFTLYTEPFRLSTGPHVLVYGSRDRTGNFSEIGWRSISVDNTPPVTRLTLQSDSPPFADGYGNLFYPATHQILLNAVDVVVPASGEGETYYQFANVPEGLEEELNAQTEFQFYPFETGITLPEGQWSFSYGSKDNVNNYEVLQSTAMYVDGTPPVTGFVVNGASTIDGNNITYNAGTTFSLMVVDPISPDEPGGLASGAGETSIYIDIDPHADCPEEPVHIDTAPVGSCENPFFGPDTPPIELAVGTHTVTFFSIDNVGNEENENVVEVTVSEGRDALPPRTSLSTGAPNVEFNGLTYVTRDTVLTFEAADDLSTEDDAEGLGVATIAVEIDGNPRASFDNPSPEIGQVFSSTMTLSDTDGVLVLGYYAEDTVGNIEPVRFATVAVDNTAPSLNITLPAAGAFLATDSPSIEIEYNDLELQGGAPGSGISIGSLLIEVDGTDSTAAAAVTGSGASLAPAGLSEGTHTITAVIADLLGNENTAELTFTVDTLSPVPADPQVRATGAGAFSSTTTVLASIDAEARISALDVTSGLMAASARLSTNGGASYVVIPAASLNLTGVSGTTVQQVLSATDLSLVESASLSEPSNLIEMTLQDRAGNTTSYAFGVLVDTTPPVTRFVVNGVSTTEGGIIIFAEGTSFSLSSDDTVSGLREIGVSINSIPEQVESGAPITLPAGTYTVDFAAVDNVGNEETPQTVTVKVVPSVSPPDPRDFPFFEYSAKFGGKGGGEGLFLTAPRDIAVDVEGAVYVADAGNRLVQKFDSEGNFLLQWGESGTGPGQFSRNWWGETGLSVAYTPSGSVWVADGVRLQKFNPDGTYLSEIIFPYWQYPLDVTIGARGDIYVSGQTRAVDYSNPGWVHHYDKDGNFVKSWETGDSGSAGYFRQLASDSDDNIYVIDNSQGKVRKFNSDGDPQGDIGSYGSGPGQLYSPQSLTIDAHDNIYVANSGNSRVELFTNDGDYITSFGTVAKSTGGVLGSIWGIGVDRRDGKVYIASYDGPSVKVYSIDRSTPAAPVVYSPAGGITVGSPTPRILGRADELTSSIQVREGQTTVAEASVSTDTGRYVAQFTTALSIGAHNLEVVEIDPAGHISIGTPLSLQVRDQPVLSFSANSPVSIISPAWGGHGIYSPPRLIADDFDNDGKADLISLPHSDRVIFSKGNGDGTFTTLKFGRMVDFSWDQNDASAVDMNKDGNVDLVLTQNSGLLVLLGDGEGAFTSEEWTPLGFLWRQKLAIADFNGDGYADAAVVGDSSTDGPYVFINDMSGRLQPAFTLGPLEENAGSLAAGDVDGDGKADIFTGSTFFFGDGTGGFEPGMAIALPLTAGSDNAAILDLNQDGLQDVQLTRQGRLYALINLGGREFFLVESGGTEIGRMSQMDADQDGLMDQVVMPGGVTGEPFFQVLPNNGEGSNGAPQTFTASGGAESTYGDSRPALADFNDDGITDVAIPFVSNGYYTAAVAFNNTTDNTAPSAVVLAASLTLEGKVLLSWTAPGDNEQMGLATAYDVRNSLQEITTPEIFNAASDPQNEPVPAPPGTQQNMTISDLPGGETFYFALRTEDDAGNISDLSNSPSIRALYVVKAERLVNGEPELVLTAGNLQPTIAEISLEGPTGAEIIVAAASQLLARVSRLYELGPDGASLSPPATLTVRYSMERLAELGLREEDLAIYKYDQVQGLVLLGDQSHDTENKLIRTPLGEIASTYAIFVTIRDLTPPITSLQTMGEDRYEDGQERLFVSGRTELALEATDPIVNGIASGVDFTEYRVDAAAGDPFERYVTAFSLAEGQHAVEFRSQDKDGNLETTVPKTIFVDRTPPNAVVTFTGTPYEGDPSKATVLPQTPVGFAATDPESGGVTSGVKGIFYLVDQTYVDPLTTPLQPFVTPLQLETGVHTFTYRSVDNVNNEEPPRTIEVTVGTLAPNPRDIPFFEFKRVFGGQGAAQGQFQSPTDVAVDVKGNVYIADQGNYRIQKFGPDGNFIKEWGTSGSGAGQFGTLDGIGYCMASDRILVADKSRVQIFTTDGVFKSQIGPAPVGELKNPLDAACDSSGNIYVADGKRSYLETASHKIHKYDPDGNFLMSFGNYGTGWGEFIYGPIRVAVNKADEIYVYAVAPIISNIYRYDSEGNVVHATALSGYGLPQGLALDVFDNVYITKPGSGSGEIQVYTNDTLPITQFGTNGSAYPGEFMGPLGLDVSPLTGHIYIADTGNNKIQVFAVDTQAPAPPTLLSLTDGRQIFTQTPTIAGAAEPGTTVEVFDGASSLGSVEVSIAGLFSLPEQALTLGAHSIRARATDSAGNQSPDSVVNINVFAPPELLFDPPRFLAAEPGSSALFTYQTPTADFNKDGNQDIMAIGSGAYAVFLGNGNGTFQPQPVVRGDLGLGRDAAVADFNNDGNVDVIVLQFSSLDVALGNGNGTFQSRRRTTSQTTYMYNLAIADFDGDGFLDAAATRNTNELVLAYGNGNGTFRLPHTLISLPTGAQATGIATADFNEDGRPDLAIGDTVLLRDESGFQSGTLLTQEDNYFRPVAGDLTGDGHVDLLLVPGLPPAQARTFYGAGNGRFIEGPGVNSPYNLDALRLADFNGDRAPDLAGIRGYGAAKFMAFAGLGDASHAPAFIADTGVFYNNNLTHFSIADFNNDLRPDVVIPLATRNAGYDMALLINTSPVVDRQDPATVDLQAAVDPEGTITLTWAAPGDDGMLGTAESYEIRHSQTQITSVAEFEQATPITAPPPQLAGTPESLAVTDLPGGQTIFFALRAYDDAGNPSELSNSPSVASLYVVRSSDTVNGEPELIFTASTVQTTAVKLETSTVDGSLVLGAANVLGVYPVSSIYDVGPENVNFNPPATLTIRYSTETVNALEMAEEDLAIYEYFAGVGLVKVANQTLDTENKLITVSLGNIASIFGVFGKIRDVKAPETTLKLTGGEQYKNAVGTQYASSSTSFGFEVFDPVFLGANSGVAFTEFRVNPATPSVQFTTFTEGFGLAEGIQRIEFRSQDNAGNLETIRSSTVLVDATPPASTLAVGHPSFVSAASATYISPLTEVRLQAVDSASNEVASGLRETLLSVDGSTFAAQVGTFTLPGEDGISSLKYFSVDNVGNEEVERLDLLNVDATSPVTQLNVVSGKHLLEGTTIIASGDSAFGFQAEDPEKEGVASGVRATIYSLDEGDSIPAVSTFTFSEEGFHKVGYYSRDNVENEETAKYRDIHIDKTPPLTQLVVSGPAHEVGDVLYLADISTITLQSADPISNNARSGFGRMFLTVDGSTSVSYSALATFNFDEGAHSLSFQSEDRVENLEALKSKNVSMDAMPPITSLTVDGRHVNTPTGLVMAESAAIVLSAQDAVSADVSAGVKRILYSVDGSSSIAISTQTSITFAAGAHFLTYQSEDNVGNLETLNSFELRVDATPPAVAITQPLADGIYVASRHTLVIDFAVTDDYDPGPVFTGILVQHGDRGSPRGARPTLIPVTTGQVIEPLDIDDGIWELQVSATDFVLNSTFVVSGTFEILHDIQPPRTDFIIGAASAPATSGNSPSSHAVFVRKDTPFRLSSTDDLLEERDAAGLGIAFQELSLDGQSYARFNDPAPAAGQSLVSTFTLASESDGLYELAYFAEDAIGNREIAQTVSVALDDTGPQSAFAFSVPPFMSTSGVRFASVQTTLGFTAEDPMTGGAAAGVAAIETSVDGAGYAQYVSSLTFAEGRHAVLFRAVDRVGNVEVEQTLELRTDNTPPVTTKTTGQSLYAAPDGTDYVTPVTQVSFAAADLESQNVASGVRRIEVNLDGAGFATYTEAMTFAEGRHAVLFRAIDNVDNTETTRTYTVRSDATPPVTAFAPGGTLYTDGTKDYAPLGFTYALPATDPVANDVASGVKETFYAIDGASLGTYTAAFSLTEGIRQISYRSVDNVGNTEPLKNATVYVDATAPDTTLGIAGGLQYPGPDSASFYASPATRIGFIVADPVTQNVASGADLIQYQDNAGAFITYAAPLALTEGAHALRYRARDNVGNVEVIKSTTVLIDGTAPESSYAIGSPFYSDASGTKYITPATPVTFSATDTASGVERIEVSNDGGTYAAYSSALTFVEGRHTILFRARDRVGNIEAAQTLEIRSDSTPPVTVFAPNSAFFSAGGRDYAPLSYSYSLSSVDPVVSDVASGVKETLFSIDGSLPSPYMAAFTFAKGIRRVEFHSLDNVGNDELLKSATVYVDATAPATTLRIVGGKQYPGTDPSSFYASADTVYELPAADPTVEGVSAGLAWTRYRIDQGAFQNPAMSFTLTEGENAVDYQSQDNVGNLEVLRSTTVFVDATPPVTTVSIGSPQFIAGDGTRYITPQTPLDFTASDPNLPVKAGGTPRSGSGVERIEVSVDGDDFSVSTASLYLSEGRHSVRFRAVDHVGNIEEAKEIALRSDATPPVSSLEVGEPAIVLPDGTLLVGAPTPLGIQAADPAVRNVVSGLSETLFRIVNSTTNVPPFTVFSGTFTLPGMDGPRTIEFFSRDNVDNEEVVRSGAVFLDATPPIATLHSPGADADGICRIFGGPFPIIGTVVDERLREFRLEYAPGKDAADSFVPIASGTVSIEDGVLAVWDAAGFSGFYTLRLTASDLVGNAISVVINVFIGDPARQLVLGGGTTFNHPEGVAAGPENRIYVADTNANRVRVFDASGTLITDFDGQSNEGLDLNKPKDIAVDSEGNIYIADTQHHRIVKLSPAGEELLDIGDVRVGMNGAKSFHSGADPGVLKHPEGVAVDAAGSIYVADTGNRRIQIFDSAGAFSGGFALPAEPTGQKKGNTNTESGQPGEAVGIDVDEAGNIYVADPKRQRVDKFNTSGEVLLTLGGGADGVEFKRPTGITVAPSGDCILVSDRDNYRIYKFDSRGNLTLAFGEKGRLEDGKLLLEGIVFEHPMGLALDGNGRLLVADRNNKRIQRFGLPEGETLLVGADGGANLLRSVKERVEKESGGWVVRADNTSVDIPPDALPEDADITIAPPAEDSLEISFQFQVMAGKKLETVSEAVEYGPHGMQFNRPVTITLPYDPALLIAKNGATAKLNIHYWNPVTKGWEELDSTVDPDAHTVSALTTHFSLYQVLAPASAVVSANGDFVLREVYVFPDPAVRGAEPTFHVEVGIADSVQIIIYNVAGQETHRTTLTGTPAIINDGSGADYAYEYKWSGRIPSGVYLYTISAEKAGHGPIRKGGKFAVVR